MSKTIISNDNAGTVMAPESQGTVVAPSQQGTVVAPSQQGTVVAPAGTTVAPSGTVVAGGTMVAGAGAPVQQEASRPSSKKGAKMSFRMQPGEQIMLSGKAYTIVKGVSSGTEAELYVVNDGSRDYAAKIYNRGFSPNAKILPDVMSIKDDDFIVHIYQSGIADIAGESLSYVLMDYCEYGATSNYSYKDNVGELLEIALQVAKALDTCHKNHILHKDIKPANILVKNRGPIEICLCDFGIADKLDKKEIITSQSRTVIYAAPEMYVTGEVLTVDGRTSCKLSAASDYFALGMSLLSLWVGEATFNEGEMDLAFRKKEGSLVIPRDMPATLANIVKGLTNPDPDKRWGQKEIGKELTDVLLNINQTGDSQGILYDVSNNIVIKDLEDLANYLETNDISAKRLLYRGKLSALLKSSYPELSQDLTNIVETKYTSDQASGLAAAIFAINPNVAINLKGKRNDTGGNESKALNTIKEVSDFCCSHKELDKDSKLFLLSDTFVTWLRARDANVARAVSSLSRLSGDSDYNREFNYRLIIQTIDPFADFNLCNDINDPHYAMTGAGIAWYLNEAFNVYYSLYGGNASTLVKGWDNEKNNLRHICTSEFVKLLIHSFDKQMTTHKNSYLICSLKTKGKRFTDQIKWINYCTDTEPPLGPKYSPETAMMKAAAGLGMPPTYQIFDKDITIQTLDDMQNVSKNTLKYCMNRGLLEWLAVQHHENPNAKYGSNDDYQNALNDYYRAIGRFDDSYPEYIKLCKDDFRRHLQSDINDLLTLAKELRDSHSLTADLITNDLGFIINQIDRIDHKRAEQIATYIRRHSDLSETELLEIVLLMLDPNIIIEICGINIKTSQHEKIRLQSIPELIDFVCDHHQLDNSSTDYLSSERFFAWLQVKEPEAYDKVCKTDLLGRVKNQAYGKDIIWRCVILAISDSTVDINLNRRGSPYFCPTEKEFGPLLNKSYNIFHTLYHSDENRLIADWKNSKNILQNDFSPNDIILLVNSFRYSSESGYLQNALLLRGTNFQIMTSNINNPDWNKPKDADIRPDRLPSTLMLVLSESLGHRTSFDFFNDDIEITEIKELEALSPAIVLPYLEPGLKAWISVKLHENPKDNSSINSLTNNIYRYYYCLGKINPEDETYKRVKDKENELYGNMILNSSISQNLSVQRSILRFIACFCGLLYIHVILSFSFDQLKNIWENLSTLFIITLCVSFILLLYSLVTLQKKINEEDATTADDLLLIPLYQKGKRKQKKEYSYKDYIRKYRFCIAVFGILMVLCLICFWNYQYLLALNLLIALFDSKIIGSRINKKK